ncbi:MAG: MarC family protein [Deltaproteobacteria bacterium]|nr:MarC family protein [Deltaproteobacteria bacterium]
MLYYIMLDPIWPFFSTSLVSFFVIMDPLGNVFPFLALTERGPSKANAKVAAHACFYSFFILTAFALAGRYVIAFFGISLAAFQIAGGLILFVISFDMLHGRGHFNRMDTSSSLRPEEYGDIALAPLAMPLMAGPGSITTVLVLTSRAKSLGENLSILVAIIIILFVTYFCFIYADRIVALIKEASLRVLTRIMGLILTALAVQFIIQGLSSAFPRLAQ